MGKRVGVLLSGCGFYDGCEIHEAVLTLLALDMEGAEVICMAPDIAQHHVINHITQKEMDENRNVLVESARIARGDIRNLKEIAALDLDALIIPGGFGAVKNLSNFAFKGPAAVVNPEVKRLINEMYAAAKPIGAICISPVTLTCVLAHKKPQVTIGTDPGTAEAIEAMGGRHINCGVDHIHVDQKNRLVTTPAYMVGPGIKDIAVGIEKLVKKVVSMIN